MAIDTDLAAAIEEGQVGTSDKATQSLVWGILGCFFPVFGIPSIIAIYYAWQARLGFEQNPLMKGVCMAIAGIALGVLQILALVIVLVAVFGPSPNSHD